MKTVIKNGQKFVVTDALYKALKKKGLYEADMTSNPQSVGTTNNQPANAEANQSQGTLPGMENQTIPNAETTKRTVTRDEFGSSKSRLAEYERLAKVIGEKLKKDLLEPNLFNEKSQLDTIFGNDVQRYKNLTNRIFNYLKDPSFANVAINNIIKNKDKNVQSMKERVMESLIEMFNKNDEYNRLGIPERGKERFNQIIIDSIKTDVKEYRYKAFLDVYRQAVEKFLKPFSATGKAIPEDSQIYKAFSKLLNKLNIPITEENLQEAINSFVYGDYSMQEYLMKTHIEEIIKGMIQTGKDYTVNDMVVYIQDKIFPQMQKYFHSDEYKDARIAKLKEKYNINESVNFKKKLFEEEKLADEYDDVLTTVFDSKKGVDLQQSDKGKQEEQEEQAEELEDIEAYRDTVYVTFADTKDNLVYNLVNDNDTEKTVVNDIEMTTEVGDEKHKKTRKTVGKLYTPSQVDKIKKMNKPESKFFDLEVSNAQLCIKSKFNERVVNKYLQDGDMESLSKYVAELSPEIFHALLAKNAEDDKKINVTKKNLNKLKTQLKKITDNYVEKIIKDFIKVNSDYFNDGLITGIVFDNPNRKNPIGEVVYNNGSAGNDEDKKSSLKFKSIPKIIAGVKDIELNPIVIDSLNLWKKAIIEKSTDERKTTGGEDQLTVESYNDTLDKINKYVSILYNVYLNVENSGSEESGVNTDTVIVDNLINQYKNIEIANTNELIKIITSAISSKENNEFVVNEASKTKKVKINANKKEIKDVKKMSEVYKEYQFLRLLMKKDTEDFYRVVQQLEKDNSNKQNIDVIIRNVKLLFGLINPNDDKNVLYKKYYSMVLLKVCNVLVNNVFQYNYNRLNENDKKQLAEKIGYKYDYDKEDDNSIIEKYVYYTGHYPTEKDIDDYNNCLEKISSYSAKMENVMNLLRKRLSEELLVLPWQYSIKPLKILGNGHGNIMDILKSIITGRKSILREDLFKIKSIKNSEIGKALTYSFLVDYFDKRFGKNHISKYEKLRNDNQLRPYDEVIYNIISQDSKKLSLDEISKCCFKEFTIVAGNDLNSRKIITSMREMDEFNRDYKFADYQNKAFIKDSNNISTTTIMEGNESIGYLYVYKLFGTLRK